MKKSFYHAISVLLLFLNSTHGMGQVQLNSGLIAYFPFNGNANDATGNGNNGTPMNGIQLTTDRFGNPNSAYMFDGINNYILINDHGKLSPKSVTVAAYVNTTSTAGQSITGKIEYATGNAASYHLGIDYDVQTGFFFGVVPNLGLCFQQYPYDPNNPFAKSQGTFSTNVWHCVVGTFDNGVVKVYVDGVLADTKSSPTPGLLQCSNTQTLIGSWWTGDPIRFHGKIDDVRIYDRALSDQEVGALCNLSDCPLLQGNLTGSNMCATGPNGTLTFHSSNPTGPFTLYYSDGTNTYTRSNVLDGVPFTLPSRPVATTTYSLLSLEDNTNCGPTPLSGITATVTVEKPSILTSPDTTICPGTPALLHAGGALSYSWSPGSGMADSTLADPVVTPRASTNYVVTGTSVDGCPAKDSVLVNLFARSTLILTPDTGVCAGGTAQLRATGGTSYTWSPSQTLDDPSIANPVASPGVTTQYILRATDINTCSEADSVTVIIRPAPVFHAPAGKSVCEGLSVTLGDPSQARYKYQWSPAGSLDDPMSPTPVANPSATITYTVTIADSVCAAYDSSFEVVVKVNPSPNVTARHSNDIDCTTPTSQLHASGAQSYSWSPIVGLSDPHSADPIASTDSTTLYVVQGADKNGCLGSDTVTVKVTDGGKELFAVPNAFTPNGDGHNDCFGIRRWGAVTLEEFSVFDRWGERVFTTKSPSDCWDGTFNGKVQPMGDYAYVIKASSLCGKITRTGLVSLIR